jgi:hypothetical protein
MRNLELKARDAEPARSLEVALALGADDRGVIRQRDTYFSRARARLKLREQEPGGCRHPLVEPARPQTPVHLGWPDGPRRTGSIEGLLPMAFVLDGEAR